MAKRESRWYLSPGRTLYLGPSFDLPDHQGGAPVLLVGLYGEFRLRLQNGDWLWCRTAAIPPGMVHALDFGGDPIAAIYIEPDVGDIESLVPLVGGGRRVGGAIIGTTGETSFLRTLFEDRPAKPQVDSAIEELIDLSKKRADVTALDPRVRSVTRIMADCSDDLTPVASIAESVGLSSSRFQHLFTRQIGVPYRRYRSWMRMRVAISEIVNGGNCTMAAHVAGYADLAHFTRDCRRTFGGAFTRNRNREEAHRTSRLNLTSSG